MDPKLETVELDSDNSIRTLHYKCHAFQKNHAWHYHGNTHPWHSPHTALDIASGQVLKPLRPPQYYIQAPQLPRVF